MNQTVCLICVKKDSVGLQKYTRTNTKAMSVSVIGAKLWNELDSDLRQIQNILLFKKNGAYYPRTYRISHEYLGVEKRSMIVT